MKQAIEKIFRTGRDRLSRSPFPVSRSRRRGFTLIELLVVVSMIAIILGAISTSFSSAQHQARVQKAKSEVKVISQAILAYENWGKNDKFELPTYSSPVDADSSTLAFLLGKESAESGGNIPVMLMAQLKGGGKLLDPWGHPYKIRIKEGVISGVQGGQLYTGFYLPNYYRLSLGERQ